MTRFSMPNSAGARLSGRAWLGSLIRRSSVRGRPGDVGKYAHPRMPDGAVLACLTALYATQGDIIGGYPE